MARVDDEHHRAEHVATAQVVLDHRRPAIALRARHLGVAVAGQVAEADVARPRRRGSGRNATSKNWRARVRPGVAETRASPFRRVSALSIDDLPTFERPTKASSGDGAARPLRRGASRS